MDYRELNRATLKNRYAVSIVSEKLDRIRDAHILTKLDPRNTYHVIWIQEEDEHKTAFQLR